MKAVDTTAYETKVRRSKPLKPVAQGRLTADEIAKLRRIKATMSEEALRRLLGVGVATYLDALSGGLVRLDAVEKIRAVLVVQP